ncbi:retention module-containing protein, partial [Shewanella sp. A3A]|nr:retention module-containing protein [Shewanella ferrihydritica]
MNTVTIQQSGQIKGINGQISIVENGQPRPLRDGEIVPAGAQLIVADNARAELLAQDGSLLTLDESGAAAAPQLDLGAATGGATDAEIAELQALIASGEDPTANLPETAAGGNLANQGDSGYVDVSRDGAEVLAASGYDTGTFATTADTPTDTTEVPFELTVQTANDTNTIDEDTVATGNVLTNDTSNGVDLTVVGFIVDGTTFAANDTATLESGTLTLNADGSYTFTPTENWNGTVPVVTYTTNTGDSATLTIVVTPVNDAPVLAPDVGTVDEDATLTVGVLEGVLSNDTDVDGDGLSVTGILSGTTGTATAVVDGTATVITNSYGTLTINSDGSYSFAATGAASQALATDETAQTVFTYTATDGTESLTSTLTITITGTNDAPVLTPDVGAVDEDATLTVAAAQGVLSNDTDVDGDALSVTGILSGTTGTATAVVDGTATVITNDYGTLTINADGSYSFAATGAASQALATDETAQTVFTYTATDGTDSLTSTLTITITGTNDAPVLEPDVGAVDEDATLTVAAAQGVLSNDTDVDGDGLSVTGILSGTTGTATAVVDGTATVITNSYGTLTINSDGSYSFAATGDASQALAAGATAQTVFTYTATDGTDSLTSTLTITITGTNDAPVLSPDVGAVDEDATLTVAAAQGVLSNDTDVDGDALSVTGILSGTTGTATAVVDGTATVITNSYGTLTINSDGSYSFAATGAASQALATDETAQTVFTYTATDGTDSLTSTLTITITGTNDAPVLQPDVGAVDEDATLTVAAAQGVLSNDTDVDGDALSVTGILSGTTGTATAVVDGTATVITNSYGTLTINSDGSYSFAATGAASQALATDETAQTVFTYTATDGTESLTSTLTITITGTDDGVSLTGLDMAGGEISVDEANLPGGSAENDAQLTQTGEFSFDTIDGLQTLTVHGQDFTLAQLQALNTAGGNVTIDTPQGSLTLTGFTGSIAGGTVSYSYTLDSAVVNAAGAESFTESLTISVTDTDNSVANGSLDIVIADDTPTAIDDTDSIAAGSYAPAVGNVITGAGTTSDGADTVGADDAHISAVAFGETAGTTHADGSMTVAGAYGVLTINADGSYSYARNAGSSGGVSEVFSYTLTDGDGDNSPATLTISIGDSTPTVEIPTAGGETTTVYEAGLPARGAEPAGSDATSDSESTSGSISFTSSDGVSTISLGGHLLTTVDQTFAEEGLTARYEYNAATGVGSIIYSYTLLDNTSGDNTSVSFPVVITDADGDVAPAGDLTINIVDDAPTAVNDTDTLAFGDTTASGNVIDGTTVVVDGDTV